MPVFFAPSSFAGLFEPMFSVVSMPQPPPVHVPVLLAEVLEWIDAQPGSVVVDGTLGGGGHARRLAEAVGSSGRVLALDRDPEAIARAEEQLAGFPVEPIHANFCDLPEVLAACEIERVDGILLDLGLSSLQLADEDRGFSFSADGPLDLRFDPTSGEPAARLVNRLSPKHLADLIYQYGEERHSRRIARAIADARQQSPISTAGQLADLVRRSVPRRPRERIDPATRTFQALRIAVNDEIRSLQIALGRLPDCLRGGGRLAIISFHSLEDRPVKTAFAGDDRLEPLTRRPIRPTEIEVSENPRARSAKLRVAQRTRP